MCYKCYLCEMGNDKENKIALHSFPDAIRYPHLFKQWLHACCLDEKDDVSHLRICTRHFLARDRVTDYTFTRIRPGSTPSINVPNPIILTEKENCTDNSGLSGNLDENRSEQDTAPTADSQDINDSCVPSTSDTSNFPIFDTPHFQQPADFLPTIKNLSQEEGVISKTLENIDDLDEHFELLYNYIDMGVPCITLAFPVKRSANGSSLESSTTSDKNCRFLEPKHVSELQYSDISNPRSASRTLKFVKERDRQKVNKIKRLQQDRRRLIKRVKNFQDLLSDLKNQ